VKESTVQLDDCAIKFCILRKTLQRTNGYKHKEERFFETHVVRIFCCAQRTTACSSSGIDSTKVDLYFLANKLFFRYTDVLQAQLRQANV
jgi:hypothetical protein